MPESFQASVSQSTTPPALTVVVICFNDAKRLPNAVSSVLAQSERNLEVIIVDDHSQDATPEVSEKLAEQDSRVRVHRHLENSGGCGAPRNTGLALARSKYVMFLDSDDELTPYAAELLLASAEKHGSDITAGGMERRHVADGKTEPWYPRLYRSEQHLKSLHDRPGLVHDTVATNKMYRTDFFIRTTLRFPVGVLYEDVIFTAQAMTMAKGISIIPDLIYLWMVYPDEQRKSITNQRTEQRNIRDRFMAVRKVREIYRQQPVEVRIQADIKALRHHLMLYVNDVLMMSNQTATLLVEEGSDVISEIEIGAISSFTPTERAIFAAVIGQDLTLLRTIVEARENSILPGCAVWQDEVLNWTFPGSRLPDDEIIRVLLDFSVYAEMSSPPKELTVEARVISVEQFTSGPRLRGTVNLFSEDSVSLPAFLLRQQGEQLHSQGSPVSFVQRTSLGWTWEADLPPLKRDSRVGASPVSLELIPRESSHMGLSPLSPAPYPLRVLAGVKFFAPVSTKFSRILGDHWESNPQQLEQLELIVSPGRLGKIVRSVHRLLRQLR